MYEESIPSFVGFSPLGYHGALLLSDAARSRPYSGGISLNARDVSIPRLAL